MLALGGCRLAVIIENRVSERSGSYVSFPYTTWCHPSFVASNPRPHGLTNLQNSRWWMDDGTVNDMDGLVYRKHTSRDGG